MKKILFFAIALIVSVMSVNAKTQVDGIWYILDEENATATVTYGEEDGTYAGRLIIPEYIEWSDSQAEPIKYPITAIGDSAFKNCPNLTGITIPGSVENIGSAITIGSDYIAEVKFEDRVRSSVLPLIPAPISTSVVMWRITAVYRLSILGAKCRM